MGTTAKASKAKGGTAKPKKEKKVKDPNAPKRPKSAYFFYLDDVREQVKTDNPGMSIGDMSKIMGNMWNEIKETAAAEKYTKKAADDKVRYEKAKEAYESKQEEAKEVEEEEEEEDKDE